MTLIHSKTFSKDLYLVNRNLKHGIPKINTALFIIIFKITAFDIFFFRFLVIIPYNSLTVYLFFLLNFISICLIIRRKGKSPVLLLCGYTLNPFYLLHFKILYSYLAEFWPRLAAHYFFIYTKQTENTIF